MWNMSVFLGICLGMQLAVIEFARNVCHIEDANSTEFDEVCNSLVEIAYRLEIEIKEKETV